MGANIAKTIVGGLGIAVGAIALTGLMATPVGWGLAGAALAAGAIYGGVKAYKMYQEHQKKKAFAANGEAGKIDQLRTSVESAQQALDSDESKLLIAKTALVAMNQELSNLNDDETNDESINYKNKKHEDSQRRISELEQKLREANESNTFAQSAYDTLQSTITEEVTALGIATKAIEDATAAAAKAKQDFADVQAANLAVLQALKEKFETPPRTASDPPSKSIADVAFWHRDQELKQKLSEDQGNINTRGAKLVEQRLQLGTLFTAKTEKEANVTTANSNKSTEEATKATLSNSLEAAKRKKSQLEGQSTGTITKGEIKTKEEVIQDLEGANGTGGTLAGKKTDLTVKMGEENKQDRYASGKGTVHIVAYEIAKAIKANQAQATQSLTTKNELQNNITKEGEDAFSIAEAINITYDPLTASNPTAPAPDPLLIELIETKLSLSKSM
jgi:chromosome segregation ATPase